MRRFIVLLLLMLLPAGACLAAGLSELKSVIHAAKPYGSGSVQKSAHIAYEAALWMDAPQWSYDAPFALTFTYQKDVSSEELVDVSMEEMNRIYNDDPSLSPLTALLAECLPNVRKSDRVTIFYDPRKGLVFYHNGKKTGKITSLGLAEAFLDIWLSEYSSYPELRAKLLRL